MKMKLRLGRLGRRAALPLVLLALLVGPSTATFPDAALAHYGAEDLYNSARDLLERSEYAAAVDAFSRAIDFDPYLVPAYVGRATAYQFAGNPQAALQDYNHALLLDSNQAEALYNRGVLLAQTGDKQGAIQDLQRAADAFRQRGDELTADLAAQVISLLQQ
jgi:tetratricopeptide (TPR) repeat protein